MGGDGDGGGDDDIHDERVKSMTKIVNDYETTCPKRKPCRARKRSSRKAFTQSVGGGQAQKANC